MFSGRALQRIEYGVVAGVDQVADFDFEETSNPAESWVRLRFAQVATWDDSSTIELTFDSNNLPD